MNTQFKSSLKVLRNIALDSIDTTLDGVSDDVLRLISAMMTTIMLGEPAEASETLKEAVTMIGELSPHEFATLNDAVERAINRRFGPVPGY